MKWIDQLAGIRLLRKTIPRCEVCDAFVIMPTVGLMAHTLCQKHCDMARGAYQWVICKIDRPMLQIEEIEIANAVIQCLREEEVK